jgi:hypothetical protein
VQNNQLIGTIKRSGLFRYEKPRLAIRRCYPPGSVLNTAISGEIVLELVESAIRMVQSGICLGQVHHFCSGDLAVHERVTVVMLWITY